MAKQTYTTGQVLTAAQMTTLQANDYNWTVSAKTASYVLVAADAGTRITMSNAGATTITVNTALFTAGDTLTITNIGAGACTITAGTATVSTAGSLILNQYDSGTLYFSSTSAAIWNGANPGDITGITTGATSGLAGGVTSGTASLTLATAAKGDLLVGTGANTAQVLTVGSNNQTLVADSTASTGLKWATPAGGGGKVLQVVSTTKTDTFTSTSTSFADITGLSVSITPSSATSKVMVFYNVTGSGDVGTNTASIRLVRGTTAINIGDTSGSRTPATNGIFEGEVTAIGNASTNFLDSPSTTSATTYKVQVRCNNTGNAFINRCENNTDQGTNNTTTSTITVMEIGA
jgi:hypothetical protein